MKKLLLLTGLGLFLTVSNASAQKTATSTTTTMTTADSWTASTTGYWVGQNNVSVKYNKATNKVQQSSNGTTWVDAPNNNWMDVSNKKYKVDSGKLKQSTDAGTTWTDASPACWKAFDGKVYKFDASWNLMVQK